jgi:DNA-binding CsgD family transcriptional regulator
MLIGRSAEMAQLAALLEQVRAGMSGAVLLRGEAGIGKTALLNAVADAAGDLSVMRLEGIESEMQLGYAALHRLMLPHLARMEHLPDPQRNALGSAFGLASVAPADRFLVGLAALSLLGDVAKDDPLLVVVDDAQWLDHESIATLVFVARRLHADGIALVFAARESAEIGTMFQGIAELWVAGLSEAAARQLLNTSVSDPVSHQVAGRIIDVTRGNPLALLELSNELSSAHLMDRSPLPDPLPIGELIEARFLRQVRRLPADTQTTLLVAAADSEGDPATLRRAGETLGLSADAVEPAVAAGLLMLEPRVEFRHPLVRSSVYGGATAADRRRVHQALAAVMDPERDQDRRALHLASAALGPDEDLAETLERSATQARARGGYVAESSFLVRAASLSPDSHRRAGRILSAAQAAYLAGNFGYADSLLAQSRPHLVDPVEQAQAQRLDGLLRLPLGQPQLAPALLLGAARAFEPIDPDLSRHAFLEAFLAVAAVEHLAEGITVTEIAQAALENLDAQSTPPTTADMLLKGVALRYAGSYLAAVPAMREAVLTADRLSYEEMSRWTHLATIIAVELWDEVAVRKTMEKLERAARALGSLPSLQVALHGLATTETRAGRFSAAREKYSELHDVTMAIGGYVEFYDLFEVGLLAWLGGEEARPKAVQLRELSSAFHAAGMVHYANLALAVLNLAEGHYEEALAAARSIIDADAVGWSCDAIAVVVEAATRCGDDEAAADALERLDERGTASGTPWALGLLARCRALVADSSVAPELFEESLDHFSRTSWLTEEARTHLLYGEWLRRQKRRTEAREQLRLAYEMFDAMGAKPFAERARVELLATGERTSTHRAETAHDLTPRELQIARLAAQRATSREIAGQLFISANTVDYHLRKVFQKLGVTSRRNLSGVLLGIESRTP